MLGITLKETRVYREIKEEGRQEEAANLIIRLLTKRFGELSAEICSSISSLSLLVLEDLSEGLLYLTSLADLLAWLEAVQN
ncbi:MULTISPECIES: DUF4351 domain-containing protein [unclassified Nostoc]|uniref:DUF4351 domain-containing protein n=1 Tax=unclassified Nostoc TaxID=2593658 RepID=UPI0026C895E6